MLWVLRQIVYGLNGKEAIEKVSEETGISLPMLRRIAELEGWYWLFLDISPATVALSVTAKGLGFGRPRGAN